MQYTRVMAFLLLLSLSQGVAAPAPVAARAPASTASVSLAWVRVDPQRPLTVYVGGTRNCPRDYCPVLERSDDGSITWTDLRPRLGNLHGFSGVNTLTGPAQMASDGQRLYIPTYYQGAGPHDIGPNVLLSGDGGYHWRWSGLDTAVDGSGLQQVALSPISTTRVYGVYDEGSDGGPAAYRGLSSEDGGATWQTTTSPTGAAFGVVPEPQRLDTIYANVAAAQPDPALAAAQPFAARSDDAGLHWSLGSPVFAGIYTGQGLAPVAPAPTSPSRLYFSQTRHTVQGDMLRYWQNHGGLAAFGAPLSEVVPYHNGDGSGRTYHVQWFQNARLERHPENHDPRYAILLGLLGKEWWRAP